MQTFTRIEITQWAVYMIFFFFLKMNKNDAMLILTLNKSPKNRVLGFDL